METNIPSFLTKAGIARLVGLRTITVTPEIAKKWLSLNNTNRPVRETSVNEYVRRMKAGEWCLNGQAIILSKAGTLLDGQHRLEAVVRFGSPVQFDVRFGVDINTFASIDDGFKRTGGDVLYIQGVTNAVNVSAAIKAIFRMTSGRMNSKDNNSNRPSNEMVSAFYWNHPHIGDFVNFGYRMYQHSGRIMAVSDIAAYTYMMAEVNNPKAYEFMSALFSGVNLSASSPIYHLRTKLIRSKVDRNARLTRAEKHAHIVKAWRYYLEGREVKVLKIDTEREYALGFSPVK